MTNYRIVSRDDELYHYGVVGMKWGVKRGKATQAYTKAVKKKQKIEKKIDSVQRKAAKYRAKGDKNVRRIAGWGLGSKRKAAQAYTDAAIKERKAKKLQKKAEKWIKSMDETFKDYRVVKKADGSVELIKKKG